MNLIDMNDKLKRIIEIDILKVFAVILVLNSHMDLCYGEYYKFSAGGSLGDALFFFCSGFTLFIGRSMRFDNWYKRRMMRILPTVIATAIVIRLFWGEKLSIIDMIITERYWFLGCILIYYVLLYPIKEYVKDKWLVPIWCLSAVILVGIYYFWFNGVVYWSLYRYYVYFLFMLQGAIIGKNVDKYKFKYSSIPFMIMSAGLWFVLVHFFTNHFLQILAVFDQLLFTYFTFIFSKAPFWDKLYNTSVVGNILYIVGGLCLESYLIQKYVFTDILNFIFPLNVPIIMILVFIVAYIIKIFSEFITQTIHTEPYKWKRMIFYKRD